MAELANILFVDDEERVLRSLSVLFRGIYNIHTASSGDEAIDIVRNTNIHVIISDQRMPEMLGVDVLKRVKEISPNTMRLLLTGYSDLDAIVRSVNDGEVFRYINKPWDNNELKHTVEMAASIAMQLLKSGLDTPTGTGPATSGLGLMLVGHDETTLVALKELLPDNSPAFVADSIESATNLLGQHDIGVIITELYVNETSVADFIKILKANYPEVVVLVLTANRDGETIVGLINQGQIFRYLSKPVKKGMLSLSLKSAIRHHNSLRSKPLLVEQHKVDSLVMSATGEKSAVNKAVGDRLRALRKRVIG
jgi:serine/threonine-protein kinase